MSFDVPESGSCTGRGESSQSAFSSSGSSLYPTVSQPEQPDLVQTLERKVSSQRDKLVAPQATLSAQPQSSIGSGTPLAIGRSESVKSSQLASSVEQQRSGRRAEQARLVQGGKAAAQPATLQSQAQANLVIPVAESGGHGRLTTSPRPLQSQLSRPLEQGIAQAEVGTAQGAAKVVAATGASAGHSAPTNTNQLEKINYAPTPECAQITRLDESSEERMRYMRRSRSTPDLALAVGHQEIQKALKAIRERKTAEPSDIARLLAKPGVINMADHVDPEDPRVTESLIRHTTKYITKALEMLESSSGTTSPTKWAALLTLLIKLPINYGVIPSKYREEDRATELRESASRNADRSDRTQTLRRGASAPSLSPEAAPLSPTAASWEPQTRTVSEWGQIYHAFIDGRLPPSPSLDSTDTEKYEAWTSARMPAPPLGPHPETMIYELWAHIRASSAKFTIKELLDDESRKYQERLLGRILPPTLGPSPAPGSQNQIYWTWYEGRLPPSPPSTSTSRQTEQVWDQARLPRPIAVSCPEWEIYMAWARRRLPNPPIPFPMSGGGKDLYRGWWEAKQRLSSSGPAALVSPSSQSQQFLRQARTIARRTTDAPGQPVAQLSSEQITDLQARLQRAQPTQVSPGINLPIPVNTSFHASSHRSVLSPVLSSPPYGGAQPYQWSSQAGGAQPYQWSSQAGRPSARARSNPRMSSVSNPARLYGSAQQRLPPPTQPSQRQRLGHQVTRQPLPQTLKERVSEARALVGQTPPPASLLPSPSTSFLSRLSSHNSSKQTEPQAGVTSARSAQVQKKQNMHGGRPPKSPSSVTSAHSVPIPHLVPSQAQIQRVSSPSRQSLPRQVMNEEQQAGLQIAAHDALLENSSQPVQPRTAWLTSNGEQPQVQQLERSLSQWPRLGEVIEEPHEKYIATETRPRDEAARSRSEEDAPNETRGRFEEAPLQPPRPIAILPPTTRVEVERRRKKVEQRRQEEAAERQKEMEKEQAEIRKYQEEMRQRQIEATRQQEEARKRLEEARRKQEDDEKGWSHPRPRGPSRRAHSLGQGQPRRGQGRSSISMYVDAEADISDRTRN